LPNAIAEAFAVCSALTGIAPCDACGSADIAGAVNERGLTGGGTPVPLVALSHMAITLACLPTVRIST
jgi:hypothetical protein